MSINIPQISPFSAFDNSPITIIDPSGEKGIHYLTITHSDGSSVRLRLVIEDNYSVMQRVAGLSSDGHNILKYFWYDFEQEHRVIFQEDGGFAVESDPPRILDVAYINSSEMLGNLILDVLPEETMTSIPGGVAFYTEDGSGDPTWTVSESNVATVDITVLMAYFKAAGKSARSSTVRRQYSPGGGIGKKQKNLLKSWGTMKRVL